MEIDDVIEYTDGDGRSRRVVVGDLLSTEEADAALRDTANKAGVAMFSGDAERGREDILADLDGRVDDDDLACALTGAVDASVSRYLTPLDLTVAAARQEAYGRARSGLELTIYRILAGRDESIPVHDDDPTDLVGEWIYAGDPEAGPRLCCRWHADLPAGVEVDIDSFATNAPDGDWGDVEDTAVDLTPAQRKQLATWVADQVADHYADHIKQAVDDVNTSREQLDLLLLEAVKAGASKTRIAAAADVTRQTLDARTGHWRRRNSEVVEQQLDHAEQVSTQPGRQR